MYGTRIGSLLSQQAYVPIPLARAPGIAVRRFGGTDRVPPGPRQVPFVRLLASGYPNLCRRLDERKPSKPKPEAPTSIIVQVEGSGTVPATGVVKSM